MSDFVEAPQTEEPNKRPKLWRWILGTFIILISWLVIGAIITAIVAQQFGLDLQVLAGTDKESLATIRSYEPWQAGSTVLVSFLPLLLVPILLHRYLLRLPLKELFTRSNRSFSREVLIGALVMSLLLLGTGLPDFIFNNDSYAWSFDAAKFIPYLLVAFTLIPLQTTAEEVFYRGWIQQRLENGRRSIYLVSVIGGALFALPHLGNPEVSGNLLLPILGYGSTGFMLTWVTMRDQSMGLAVGAHAANNILAG
ncbi:MAG: CPBP family intramembrane metalloprotease, partial [Actinobacteria bacterium]|nr:CPBP family intramembrane metalloprotease [Actinomycetota bacterium]